MTKVATARGGYKGGYKGGNKDVNETEKRC